MKPKSVAKKTVRRSVALPRRLVEEVTAAAPPELRGNLNRLVIVALEEFGRRQRARAFDKEMEMMSADPDIRTECASIAAEFAPAEGDGLGDHGD